MEFLGAIAALLIVGIYVVALWLTMSPSSGVDEAALIRARADEEFKEALGHYRARAARRRHHMRED